MKLSLLPGRLLWLVVLVATADARSEIALTPRSLLDGKVEMLVPTSFQPMPEAMLKLKYPMESRPTFVLSNETGTVSIALNHTRNAMPIDELDEAHAYFDQTFRKLYPSAEWFRSEIASIGGRPFIVLELRTPAVDTEIRNLMLASSLDERLLLVTVNVTKELEGEWMATVRRIVESVSIKP